MAFVVTEKCILCKYTECVQHCPTDCFFEGETMLYINPDLCIDCGACEPDCPIDAIIRDDDEDGTFWLEVNKKYAQIFSDKPITQVKDPMPDAEKYKDEDDKYKKYFSDNSYETDK